MFSLSPSELASLALLGDLVMNPLAARVSSLVLLKVSLQEEEKVAIISVPLLMPTLPSEKPSLISRGWHHAQSQLQPLTPGCPSSPPRLYLHQTHGGATHLLRSEEG